MAAWDPELKPIHQCFDGQIHGCRGTMRAPKSVNDP